MSDTSAPFHLKLWHDFDRREVHGIFSPDTTFTPQTGTWGLQGIVRVPGTPADFVFFVTFGQKQGAHDFEESISEDGVLVWQSQPSQDFQDARIQQLRSHDDSISNVHLFLRTRKDLPYTYLGKLGYLDVDPDRERPVHFAWQLLAGAPPADVCARMGLSLVQPADAVSPIRATAGSLTQVPTPKRVGQRRRGVAGRRAVLPGQDARNAELGLAGELLVLAHERSRLSSVGRADLASRVVHVSVIEGDGAGYDIRSYNDDGTDRHVEVKTTRGPASNAFYISPNEVDFSERHPDSYVLVRVFGYDDALASGNFFEQAGSVGAAFALTPSEYRATLLPPGS